MDLSEFKQIPDYPDYYINKQGVVYSTKVNRVLTIHKNSTGYSYVTLTYDSKRTNILLHRLMAYMFLGMPSLHNDEYEVHHLNTNIENNKLDNLEFLTKLEHRAETVIHRNLKIKSLSIREHVIQKYGIDNGSLCKRLSKKEKEKANKILKLITKSPSRYHCKHCGKDISKKSKTMTCASCILLDYETHTVVARKPTTLLELIYFLDKFNENLFLIGIIYGVSDVAVRKWLKKLTK